MGKDVLEAAEAAATTPAERAAEQIKWIRGRLKNAEDILAAIVSAWKAWSTAKTNSVNEARRQEFWSLVDGGYELRSDLSHARGLLRIPYSEQSESEHFTECLDYVMRLGDAIRDRQLSPVEIPAEIAKMPLGFLFETDWRRTFKLARREIDTPIYKRNCIEPKPVRRKQNRKPATVRKREPTPRQLEAVRLHGEFDGNVSQVAKAMGIAPSTATQHIESGYKNLGTMAKLFKSKPRTQKLPDNYGGSGQRNRR